MQGRGPPRRTKTATNLMHLSTAFSAGSNGGGVLMASPRAQFEAILRAKRHWEKVQCGGTQAPPSSAIGGESGGGSAGRSLGIHNCAVKGASGASPLFSMRGQSFPGPLLAPTRTSIHGPSRGRSLHLGSSGIHSAFSCVGNAPWPPDGNDNNGSYDEDCSAKSSSSLHSAASAASGVRVTKLCWMESMGYPLMVRICFRQSKHFSCNPHLRELLDAPLMASLVHLPPP